MAWDTENAWRPDWHGRWRSHKPGQALVEQNVARSLLRVRNTGTTERLRLICLDRQRPRHLEGPYPFHLSQVSCSKLMAFPEALYLVVEALDESAQRRWHVAVEVRYTCLVGLRRSLPRYLEGHYPFPLSQVSCSKLMAFPEALYLVVEALDESAQHRWRVAVEVRCTCLVGLRRSLASVRVKARSGRCWRLESESNRRTRSCSPLHDHSAIQP